MQELSVFVGFLHRKPCFPFPEILIDRTLYTPERLASIAATAGQEGSIFSADDRLGLLQDAMALAKAGFGQLSSVLTLIELWHNEQDSMLSLPSSLGLA